MKHRKFRKQGEERYPVRSRWTVKGTGWLDKGDIVEIIDNGEPGKHRKVLVQSGGRQGWISVKKLKKRIFPKPPKSPKPPKPPKP